MSTNTSKFRFILAILTIGILIGATLNSNAQIGYFGPYYKHIATASTISQNITIIDHPILNNNASAICLMTDNFDPNSVYNNFYAGVWYDNLVTYNNWSVYAEGGSTVALPVGSAYNILIPSTNGTIFKQTATSANTSNNQTLIDHAATNNNPNALIFITHNWGTIGEMANIRNDHATGVYYNGTKWAIFNEDAAPFLVDLVYNVFVTNSSMNAFIHTATATNIVGHITLIDNPALNGNPNAIILVTHNYESSGVYNNHPIGVYYDGSKWTVYNQDMSAMPDGIKFNVLIADNLVSVNEKNGGNAIKFSPSPVMNEVVFSNANGKALHVQLFDFSGKLLISKQITNQTLDVSMLQPGLYFLQINSVCHKLIKE